MSSLLCQFSVVGADAAHIKRLEMALRQAQTEKETLLTKLHRLEKQQVRSEGHVLDTDTCSLVTMSSRKVGSHSLPPSLSLSLTLSLSLSLSPSPPLSLTYPLLQASVLTSQQRLQYVSAYGDKKEYIALVELELSRARYMYWHWQFTPYTYPLQCTCIYN